MARTVKTFLELLQTCRRSKFVDFRLNSASISGLILTPVGQLLRNNLRTEWNRLGTNTSRGGPNSIPLFIRRSNRSFAENLLSVQREHNNKLPPLPISLMVEKRTSHQQVKLGDTYTLELPETIELHTTYLLPPAMGTQFLYQLQRQHKIRWMRLSVDPGRYVLSDMRREEDGANRTTSVSICARFLDRSEHAAEVELERLELSEGEVMGEKPVAVVRVEHNLDRAVLAILMDALECTVTEQCVKIHRKIAPFKCGIVCAGGKDALADANVRNDLIDLSKHLNYVLRDARLAVHANSSSFEKPSPQDHRHALAQLDEIGTPYALLLSPETLRTGLLQLRSRDTTLSETIHLSDLPCYLKRIINAF